MAHMTGVLQWRKTISLGRTRWEDVYSCPLCERKAGVVNGTTQNVQLSTAISHWAAYHWASLHEQFCAEKSM